MTQLRPFLTSRIRSLHYRSVNVDSLVRVVTKSFEQASLPESLLIAMFPNGLVLDREGEDEQGEQVCPVDFDPACLKFVLDFYEKVQKQHAQVSEEAYIANVAVSGLSPMHCPLLTKPAVIVLREELDYFVLPQQQKGGQQQQQQQQLITELKIKAGDYLKQQDLVFEALQRNIEKENNVAEQHLLDMLCDAGFSLENHWDYRSLEPKRTCITSLSLVHLKTTGPQGRMSTAQKLMLFWRKPARKCWWDGSYTQLLNINVRLWARRTWTLELALI
ncbi:hypothetical protein VTP01DRAFT_67 [Rhizomucor pusillus]|uniref:uncharacterized protein n=1 Tax=Rhizomucor pusillus TaxID=4840 RepID=UPI003742D743